jgi:hypothetical protein
VFAKDCGGLGVLDLATMNKSMLCKWLWKLENTEGISQHLLSRKYLHNQVLTNATSGPGFSHFWKSLLGVNLIFQQYAKRILNNGKMEK